MCIFLLFFLCLVSVGFRVLKFSFFSVPPSSPFPLAFYFIPFVFFFLEIFISKASPSSSNVATFITHSEESEKFDDGGAEHSKREPVMINPKT